MQKRHTRTHAGYDFYLASLQSVSCRLAAVARLCFKPQNDDFARRCAILPRAPATERVTPTLHAYLRLLAWRPMRGLPIAYWYVTRRRVRARNWLRDALADAPFAYDIVMRERERLVALAAAEDAPSPDRATFSIVPGIAAADDPAWIARTIRAAGDQAYDRWEILLAGGRALPAGTDPRVRRVERAPGATPLAAGIAAAQGDFVVPLAQGDALASTALLRFAEAARAAPDAQLFYGDEDRIDRRGHRSHPWLKPRWNAEMILSLDYVSHACAIRTPAARETLDDPIHAAGAAAYGLVLAATRDGQAQVVHVPHVVAHVAPRAPGQAARVAAVAARVAGEGATAEPGVHDTVTVRWPLPDPLPAVTILIPTRDRLELVRACVDSLLAQTTYPNYTAVVIDNGSVEPATLDYFAALARDPRVQVLPCAMPYNFAAINNVAVERTGGEYLCFLNNDTEVIAGDWLAELMRYAVRPGVGAVGAQLLYEDRSIQHAGVVMGLGNAAGHAHRGLGEGDPGYFAQAYAAHHASAVTAACLVVERAKFLAVGGFDAEHLQIAYNDVDLCLKLGAAGWRNVYAPQARLLHLESRSRGSDLSEVHVERYRRELAVLQQRWDTTRIVDPLHHPLLDRGSETYRPSL